MIEQLHRCLWALVGRDDVVLEQVESIEACRASASASEYIYRLMSPGWIVRAQAPIDYSTLHHVKEILETVAQTQRDHDAARRENQVLTQEINQILEVAHDVLVDEVYLSQLFARFLHPEAGFAVLRDGEALVAVGIKPQTIEYCTRRLEIQGEFSVPVQEGELLALVVEDYQGIFESPVALGEFERRLIRMKLEWLATKHRERLVVDRLEQLEALYRRRMDTAEPASSESLQGQFLALLDRAIKDSLTNAYNRGKIREVLHTVVEEYRAGRGGFALILFDIDGFKTINDRYGHVTGDRVLIQLAERSRQALRAQDVLARWGGEEFLVVLADTHADGARAAAEKLRAATAATAFDDALTVTCSYGVAEYDGTETVEQLLERVDAAMYRAKAQGGNRVVTAAPTA